MSGREIRHAETLTVKILLLIGLLWTSDQLDTETSV